MSSYFPYFFLLIAFLHCLRLFRKHGKNINEMPSQIMRLFWWMIFLFFGIAYCSVGYLIGSGVGMVTDWFRI